MTFYIIIFSQMLNFLISLISNYSIFLLDLSSDKVKLRQRAVALYFIDRFAFRAGKEKGETAGACNLRIEHLKLTKDTGQLFEIYRASDISIIKT